MPLKSYILIKTPNSPLKSLVDKLNMRICILILFTAIYSTNIWQLVLNCVWRFDAKWVCGLWNTSRYQNKILTALHCIAFIVCIGRFKQGIVRWVETLPIYQFLVRTFLCYHTFRINNERMCTYGHVKISANKNRFCKMKTLIYASSSGALNVCEIKVEKAIITSLVCPQCNDNF